MQHLITKILFIALSFFGFAQERSETGDTVPQLYDFHEVMHPIWHINFPEKNYAALREYLPAVNKSAAEIYAAELPGILRDKLNVWDRKVDEFRITVEQFNLAVEGTDDALLLEAAEKLYSAYEELNRVVAPTPMEAAEFRKTLNLIYNIYLPQKRYEKIKTFSDSLIIKAKAMKNTESLSKEVNQKEYNDSVSDLVDLTLELDLLLRSGKYNRTDELIKRIYINYQKLEEIIKPDVNTLPER